MQENLHVVRTVEDDLATMTDRILFLEKQVLEAERTIQILTVAGFVTEGKVEEARTLVQSLIWSK
jgi:hypothetical protein